MQLLVDNPADRLPTAVELQRRLESMILAKGPGRMPSPEPISPGDGYLDRAAAFLAAGKKEEARAAASEAALHSTGLVPALELYARLSDELGYTDDAITAFRRLIALDITSAETQRSAEAQLADLFLRLHRYEDAETLMESAVRVPQGPRSIVFKAAVVLGACTKLERSLERIEILLAADPRDGAVLEKKVWVLWLLHHYEEAARVARDVLEIMPDSEMCLRRLVEYETLSGNKRRAEFYRNRLLLLDVPGDQGKSS